MAAVLLATRPCDVNASVMTLKVRFGTEGQ